MKNFAEMKRALTLGVKVIVTRHDWYPTGGVIGVLRKVSTVQTNAVAFQRLDTDAHSWLFFNDGAKGFIFDGTDSFSVVLDKSKNPPPVMTYKIVG